MAVHIDELTLKNVSNLEKYFLVTNIPVISLVYRNN